jgi:hypothetical protein
LRSEIANNTETITELISDINLNDQIKELLINNPERNNISLNIMNTNLQTMVEIIMQEIKKLSNIHAQTKKHQELALTKVFESLWKGNVDVIEMIETAYRAIQDDIAINCKTLKESIDANQEGLISQSKLIESTSMEEQKLLTSIIIKIDKSRIQNAQDREEKKIRF